MKNGKKKEGESLLDEYSAGIDFDEDLKHEENSKSFNGDA